MKQISARNVGKKAGMAIVLLCVLCLIVFAGFIAGLQTAQTDADAYVNWNGWSYSAKTVTLNSNGGASSVSSIYATYGSAYGTLPSPTYSGHTFLGWSLLPEGYTQIEYVQANGQEAMTIVNCCVTNFSRIDVQFWNSTYGNDGSNSTMLVYGAGAGYANNCFEMYSWLPNTFQFNFGTAGVNGTSTLHLGENSTDGLGDFGGQIVTSSQYGLYAQYTVNGVRRDGTISAGAVINNYIPYYMTFFGLNRGNVVTPTAAGGRIYYINIWDNGTMYHAYIPCINPKGVVGFYNTLDGSFITNTCGDGFTAGPVVNGYITNTTECNIDGAHTLYAKWGTNITLDAKGGISSKESIVIGQYGTYSELPTPTRTGYDFVGWSEIESDGNYNSYSNTLPMGYEQITSITGLTGGEYIDTGTVPSAGYKLEIVAMSTDYANNQVFFYGSAGADGSTNSFESYPWTSASQQIEINNCNYTFTSTIANGDLLKITQYTNGSNSYCDVAINGGQETHYNIGGTSPSGGLTLTLGALHRSTNIITGQVALTIYSCKIWQNDTLIRNYVPCYSGADKAAGLYDLVEGKFYGNAASAGGYSAGKQVFVNSSSYLAGTNARTLYAHWSVKNYSVTLSASGATTAGTTSVSVTYDSTMPSITIPQRTGYNFAGYYSGTSGTGTRFYDSTGASANNWNLDEDPATLYADWELKAPEITAVSSDISRAYDGTESTVSVTASHDLGITSYLWIKDGVAVTGGTTSSVTVKEISDSGKYKCRITVTDNGVTKEALSAEVAVSITKATFDMSGITFTDESFEYDGNAHSLTIVGTLPTGIDPDTDKISVSYSGSATHVADGAVTVTAKFTVSGGHYYDVDDMTAKVTITAKALEVTPSVFGKGYGAAEPTLTENISTGVGSEKIAVLYTREAGEEVGKYDILTVQADNDDYAVSLASGAGADKFSITSAKLNISDVDGGSISYESALSASTITGTATSQENGSTVSGTFEWVNGNTYPEMSDSGVTKYAVKFVPSDLSSYGEVTGLEATVTVNPKTVTLTISYEDVEMEYDGVGHYGTLKVGTKTISVNGAMYTGKDGSKLIYTGGDKLVTAVADCTETDDEIGDGEVKFATVKAQFSYDGGAYIFEDQFGMRIMPQLASEAQNAVYSANIIITPKQLAITPTLLTKNYLDAEPTLEETVNGVNGETLDVVYTRVAGETVGNYDISTVALKTANGNYEVSLSAVGAKNKFSVLARKILITQIKAFAKSYGEADPTLSEDITTDVSTVVTVNYVRFAGEDAGTYNIISAESADSNYYTSFDSSVDYARFTINPKALEVTPNEYGKTYGEADSEMGQTENGIGTEKVYVVFSRAEGENAGAYNITGVTTSNGNYAPAIVGGAGDGKYTIAQKALEVTPNTFNKTFGGEEPTLTQEVDGVNSEKVTVTFTREVGEDYGTYAILTVATANGNYSVSLAEGSGEGKFVIGKLTLIVTPNAFTKVYGEDDPALTQTVKGNNDEDVEVSFTRSGTNVVGTYNLIDVTSLNDNYQASLAEGSGVGKFTITKYALAVKSKYFSKTYGGSDPNLKETVITGRYEDQIVVTYTREEGENAGSYNLVTLSTTNQNYDLSFDTVDGPNGKFTINQKELKVTPKAFYKTYGEEESDLEEVVSTTVGAETVTLKYTREAGEDAGSYDLTAVEVVLESGAVNNYDVKFASTAVAENKFTINPKNVAVSPTGLGKTYGEEEPDAISEEVATGVGEEKVTVIYTRDAGEDAGAYDIKTASLELGVTNYTVSLTNGTGAYVISPKALTVTAEAFGKTYGDSEPDCTKTVTGIGEEEVVITFVREAGEDVGTYDFTSAETDSTNYTATIEDGTGEDKFTITEKELAITPNAFGKTYGDTDEAITQTAYGAFEEEVTVTFTREAGESAGAYDITSGTPSSGNYTVKVVSGADKYTIAQRALTVTPTETHGKNYGEQEADISESLSTGYNEDTISIVFVREVGENAGTYAYTSATTENTNYALTLGATEKVFTIAKIDYDLSGIGLADAELTYNGEAQSLAVTGTLPTGLDGVAVVANYSATLKDVGSTQVTVTFTSASVNYNAPTEEYTATLTITPRAITVAPTGTIYISAMNEIGDIKLESGKHYAFANAVVGDEINAIYTAEFASTNPGDTELNVSVSGVDNGNYSLAPTDIVIPAIISAAMQVVCENDSLDYIGEAQGPKIKVMLGSEEMDCTQTFYTAEGDFLGTLRPTDAGSYEVRVQAVSQYAISLDERIAFTINRVNAEFVPNAGNAITQVYGAFVPFKATFAGLYGDGEYTAEVENDFEGDIPNAGAHKVTFKFEGSINYLPSENVQDYTVRKREAGVKVSEEAKEYNGSAQKPTYTVSNALSKDLSTFTVKVGAQTEQINAGDYVISAESTSGNYAITLTGATVFKIAQKVLTVSIVPLEGILTEGPLYFELTYSGFVEGEGIDDLEKPASVRSGNYTVGVYNVYPDGAVSKNYSFNYLPYSFEVFRNGLTIGSDNASITIDGYYRADAAITIESGENAEVTNSALFIGNAIQGAYAINVTGLEKGATFSGRIDDENIKSSILTVAYYISEDGTRTRLSSNQVKNGTVYFTAGTGGYVVVTTNYWAVYAAGVALGIGITALVVSLARRASIRRKVSGYYRWVR